MEKEFGVKGRVPIKATFDGFAYSGSPMQCGGSQHMLGILKAIREQAGKQLGDAVRVQVWRDDSKRTDEIPSDRGLETECGGRWQAGS